MRIPTTVVILALLPLFFARAGDAPPTVLLDFETGEPADGWETRDLDLVEASAPADATASGGRCLGIRGSGDAGYLFREIGVSDWRPFRALSFFARVEAAADVEIRIAAAEGTSFRSRLCRVTLAPGSWREVVLPLSHFRWDFRRPPGRFSRVGRLLLEWDGGEGTVFVDDFRLLPGDRGAESCLPTVGEQLALAFPDGDGRAIAGRSFVVLTNVSDLTDETAAPLLERLETGLELLRERYRLPGAPAGAVPLVVFSDEVGYRSFFARLGRHFRAGVEPPEADGYTALGYAATTWDPEQGIDRPVLVHEAMHGAISRMLHLASTGDWVHEALASAVQFRLHPESLKLDLRGAFRKRAKGEGTFPPLSRVLADRRPGLSRYPQLLALMEFLAEEHGDRLPGLWERLAESYRLPHESGRRALEGVLGRPIERIGAELIEWGATRDR